MAGLPPFGIIHTAISLVALGAGSAAFIRDKDISPRNFIGRLCLWTTVFTCLTGFPIMEHGGFGKPHALGIIALVVLGVAALAAKSKFGRLSPHVEVVSYTATVLFHLIPGFVETTTRLPLNNPLVKEREDPELHAGHHWGLVPAGPRRRHLAGNPTEREQ